MKPKETIKDAGCWLEIEIAIAIRSAKMATFINNEDSSSDENSSSEDESEVPEEFCETPGTRGALALGGLSGSVATKMSPL